MEAQDPKSLMYEVLDLKDEINLVASKIEGVDHVFDDMSLRMPNLAPPELGFLRTVSWLYVLYYETGKINIDFIKKLLPTYELDSETNIKNHLCSVQRLRTFLQHNLNLSKVHDYSIQEYCETWFKRNCGTPVPRDENHWNLCLNSILKETLTFLKAIRNCIRKIEIDESVIQIVDQWNFVRKRYHPPYEFDELIAIVSTDMGRDSLDIVRVRKQYYDKWVKELQLYQGDYDFHFEARRLIEHTLLNDMTRVLPITGKDIIDELRIPPGPRVGTLLEEARKINDENFPCSKQLLIEKLKAKTE
jgi:hypothetical protein